MQILPIVAACSISGAEPIGFSKCELTDSSLKASVSRQGFGAVYVVGTPHSGGSHLCLRGRAVRNRSKTVDQQENTAWIITSKKPSCIRCCRTQ
jgi:hypothetical protein